MLKSISNLGKELNQSEQQSISGGRRTCTTYCGNVEVTYDCNPFICL